MLRRARSATSHAAPINSSAAPYSGLVLLYLMYYIMCMYRCKLASSIGIVTCEDVVHTVGVRLYWAAYRVLGTCYYVCSCGPQCTR